MNVSGYVVRFCPNKACKHTTDTCCNSNSPSNQYYIDRDEVLNIVGVPLVVAHDTESVIGRCVWQKNIPDGILVKCVIDDTFFMECMLRRFNHYRMKYNKQIKDVESFCKKTLSSFSLSHNISSKQVRHVALVDTPGRKGTAVDYQKNNAVVLVRRSENKYITDNIASHSAAFLPVSDRKEYLIENTKYSINASDFGYISANRALKMANQFEFDDYVGLFRKWQAVSKTRGGKRTLSDVVGDEVDDDSTKYREAKRPKQEDEVRDAPMSSGELSGGDVIKALNTLTQGVTFLVETFKTQPPQPIEKSNTAEQFVPMGTSTPQTHAIGDGDVSVTPQVEAARPKTNLNASIGVPDKATLKLVVNSIMGMV